MLWIGLSKKFSSAAYLFKDVSNFWAYHYFDSGQDNLSKNLTPTKVERFLKLIFDLNPTCQMMEHVDHLKVLFLL